MLGAFDIKYQPRTSIKGQVLADLVTEFLEDQTKEGVQSQEAVGVFAAEISPPWTVYIDGGNQLAGLGSWSCHHLPKRDSFGVILKAVLLGH